MSNSQNSGVTYSATAPDGTVLTKQAKSSLGDTADFVAAVHTDGVWTANSLWPRGNAPRWLVEQSNHTVVEGRLTT